MPHFCLVLLFPVFLLLSIFPCSARGAVEIALDNGSPSLIQEVYLREGVSYLPLDEVLSALQLTGGWDSVAHVYRITTPRGTAVISPGSQYLRIGERFIPLSQPPRFIDGRLRIAEDTASAQLPALLTQSVYYRNLNPGVSFAEEGESTLDQLFAFILRKKQPASGPVLRAIAIDPGHGGQDPGSIGMNGAKEKDIVLEVARRLEKNLKMRLGTPVYLSRNGDYELTHQQRMENAARADVDALIILHAQASLSPLPQGIALIIRPHEQFADGRAQPGERESLRLARHIADALARSGLGTESRVMEAPLLPLGRGDLPTVLIELGYLSNPDDLGLLLDPAGQDRMAGALFEGLQNFAEAQKEISQ